MTKEERSEYNRKYRLEHKDRLKKAFLAKKYQREAEELAALEERNRVTREKYRATAKRRQQRNRDKINAATRARYKNNPEVFLASGHERRAKEKKIRFPVVEWKHRISKFDTYCPYCDSTGHKLTIDHVIPITKGGTNDIWNLVPCCTSCNCSKHNKLLWEWKPEFNFLHLMEYF